MKLPAMAILALHLGSMLIASLAAEPEPEIEYYSRSLIEIKSLPLEAQNQRLYELATYYDRLVGHHPQQLLNNQQNHSDLKPPQVLAGGASGWSPANEIEPLLDRLFPSDKRKQAIADCAISSWMIYLQYAPESALAAMKDQGRAAGATNQDIVRLVAAMSRDPGQKLTQKISKALWNDFHEHSNPCYKILALEKYDSTDQSPDELLSLYRECLMNSFGYLQVRALEGIYRSKDFRPEVATLLQEYLNSTPVANDGTLPSFPAVISNPVDGAKMILAEIGKAVSSMNQPPSKSPPASTSMPSPASKKTSETKPPPPTSSASGAR